MFLFRFVVSGCMDMDMNMDLIRVMEMGMDMDMEGLVRVQVMFS